jgi:hypothetical protein
MGSKQGWRKQRVQVPLLDDRADRVSRGIQRGTEDAREEATQQLAEHESGWPRLGVEIGPEGEFECLVDLGLEELEGGEVPRRPASTTRTTSRRWERAVSAKAALGLCVCVCVCAYQAAWRYCTPT